LGKQNTVAGNNWQDHTIIEIIDNKCGMRVVFGCWRGMALGRWRLEAYSLRRWGLEVGGKKAENK
jgi:hypothetical protein